MFIVLQKLYYIYILYIYHHSYDFQVIIPKWSGEGKKGERTQKHLYQYRMSQEIRESIG